MELLRIDFIKKSSLLVLGLITFFLGSGILGTGYAQQVEVNDNLEFSGNFDFWSFGEAELWHTVAKGNIDSEGNYTITVNTPRSFTLRTIREFSGVACLTSSNPKSRYKAISTLEVLKDDQSIAEVYYQTPRFDFNVGEAFVSFHYYSEATTVSGRCVSGEGDDFNIIYEFPDLEMQAGWNQLIGVITDLTDSSDTYTFRHKEEDDVFAWELEALDLESFVGIGATIDYPEESDLGILISEVYENGPAHSAGLEAGDIITKIDATATSNMPIAIAVLYLRGEEGSQVSLSVLRNENSLEFDIVRGLIEY